MAREPEHEVHHEPQVIEGEDEIPHQPEDRRFHGAEGASDAARFARPALWTALLILAALVALLIWLFLT